jgi:hypothetical protein
MPGLCGTATFPSSVEIAPYIRSARKGCEEVSYSSIGSSGFSESGVGGSVAMSCREAASPMRRYTPRLYGQGNTGFQLTRGLLGVSM